MHTALACVTIAMDDLPIQHRGRPLPLRIVALVALVAGIAVLIAHPWSGAKARGPVGDPGGVILAELSAIKGAVPPGAHITHAVRAEPHYTGSCTSTTPDVQVYMSFTSIADVNVVESQVAAHLRTAGWSHHTESGGRWYDNIGSEQVLANNFIYRWRKRLPQGTTAGATLQVGIPVSGWNSGEPLIWNLGATSPGIGGPKMHCGSG